MPEALALSDVSPYAASLAKACSELEQLARSAGPGDASSVEQALKQLQLSGPSPMEATEAASTANAESAAASESVSAALAGELARLKGLASEAAAAAAVARAPFVWADGPLVSAMREGDMILIDEINLAEDAVLERLNR